MEEGVFRKLDGFFSQFKPLYFKKGEIIIRSTDPVYGIYFLKKGYVKMSMNSVSGNEITINVFRPPSYFPMMLVLGRMENKYDFVAQTDIEVWRAPVDETVGFVKKDPELLFDLSVRLSKGINGLSVRIENLLHENAYKRLGLLLLYLAERFGEEKNGAITIAFDFTHHDLASFIGTTRETVSRSMEKLASEKLISRKSRRIVVYNKERLKKLLEGL